MIRSCHVRRALGCALFVVLAGCAAEDSTSTKPAGERVNSAKPSANNLIASQTFPGDPSKVTTIQTLRPADDGSLGFIGFYNGVSSFGELNAGGTPRWIQAVAAGNDVRSILTIPATGIVPNGLLVAGGTNADGDDLVESGWVSLYSSGGNLITQLQVAEVDSSRVWTSSITPVNDSVFVACGGHVHSGVLHPYVTLIRLKASPTRLEAGPDTILDALAASSFIKIVTLPSSPSELLLAAASSDGTTRRLHGLRAAWPAFGPVTVDWSQEIVPPFGTWSRLDDLLQSGGDLYVAGSVSDPRKPLASSGASWSSGIAASYTGSGAPKWVQVVSLTQHSEQFFSIAVGPTAACAAGAAARYVFTDDPKENFGYGWVSKLDLANGTLLANYTFGDDTYSSGFDSAILTAAGLLCGGWTKYELDGEPHPGWLATVGVSGASMTMAGVPTAAAAHEATREDRGIPPPAERRQHSPWW